MRGSEVKGYTPELKGDAAAKADTLTAAMAAAAQPFLPCLT